MGRRATGTFTAVQDSVHLDDEVVSLTRIDKVIEGLRGTFHIDNSAGEHRYVFEYDIHPD
ncbi:hypothetical protein [Krasilnikovia sp. M28-CT-15]|uniref:hypothetical protein n=1 Tax=Krasilnikovia sp. M28-CT-15 TaxID=3373540 RepID=UPI003875D61D